MVKCHPRLKRFNVTAGNKDLFLFFQVKENQKDILFCINYDGIYLEQNRDAIITRWPLSFQIRNGWVGVGVQ